MNSATVGLAVTPTVVSTLVSHYLNRRRPVRPNPTAHISYDQGLHLIRSFLQYASRHTVEELQSFTNQWVPHPQWVKVDEVEIPHEQLARAASLLQDQLGPDGVRRVGGKEWWQWRRPKSPLKAEWIEMKADYHARKKSAETATGAETGNRVMLYVHGGAYFFGSVDEHRYQIQRHARKLKARAIAPRYRLAPQFPFPCGLHDCLATYLYLLTQQEPNTIILAGDSAGGGMVLSLLVILRDRGIPLPAGAILISPWVDLTHSFPSVAEDCPLDYIPPSGFHHKPSPSWPPPDEDELGEIKKISIHQKTATVFATSEAGGSSESSSGVPTIGDVKDTTTRLSLVINGEHVDIKEQIQMYTTNELLAHPLVSPVMQPTLGGLPPLLIMVGGGEMLRDEQIYVAHKCANPERYAPTDSLLDDQARAQLKQYKPTDVQLQVWDDLCHVAPTLSFTSPAKYQYRAIAQFGAWALARAQKTEIDILDDDRISFISNSSTSSSNSSKEEEKDPSLDQKSHQKKQKHKHKHRKKEKTPIHTPPEKSIGKAGDPLPRFKNHMIRQRVTPHGVIYPLPPPSALPGCTMDASHVGVVKAGPVRKWLVHKRRWDSRFQKTKRRVHEQRMRDTAAGYEVYGAGEVPPPSALAGRRKLHSVGLDTKKARSLGLSLWALWGSKHDEATMLREREADEGVGVTPARPEEGDGARTYSDLLRQEAVEPSRSVGRRRIVPLPRRRSRRRVVRDERQADEAEGEAEEGEKEDSDSDSPISKLFALRRGKGKAGDGLLSPEATAAAAAAHEVGSTGKRPIVDGISVPFSLGKNAETASMVTLMSSVDWGASGSRPPTRAPEMEMAAVGSGKGVLGDQGADADAPSPLLSPGLASPAAGLERFVTAEEVPRAKT
ncbi:hypothetical protein B0T22DRAFT_21273 [Podospora appendiculata]|uniref:Alpha/beta hydrolase fold-3 domain-containing protein n=1 Tax=Podospora appendiculata TaxID=314037 RepID=A0AAE1CFJ3_9PEZI|nr:hypothetical protein B0T22DRAFT_21273 [Podospora appendiculata]